MTHNIYTYIFFINPQREYPRPRGAQPLYDALDEILGSRTPSGSEGIYNSSNNSNSYNISNYNPNNNNGGSSYNSSSNNDYNNSSFNTNNRTDYSGTGLGAGQSRGEYSNGNGQNDGRDSNSNSNSNSRVFGSQSDRQDGGYTSLRNKNGDSNGGGRGGGQGQGQGQGGSYQLKPDDYGYREYGDSGTEDTIL